MEHEGSERPVHNGSGRFSSEMTVQRKLGNMHTNHILGVYVLLTKALDTLRKNSKVWAACCLVVRFTVQLTLVWCLEAMRTCRAYFWIFHDCCTFRIVIECLHFSHIYCLFALFTHVATDRVFCTFLYCFTFRDFHNFSGSFPAFHTFQIVP